MEGSRLLFMMNLHEEAMGNGISIMFPLLFKTSHSLGLSPTTGAFHSIYWAPEKSAPAIDHDGPWPLIEEPSVFPLHYTLGSHQVFGNLKGMYNVKLMCNKDNFILGVL